MWALCTPVGGGGKGVAAAISLPDVATDAGYSAHDIARRLDEPSKRPGRSAFARDRARILHSASFRRLAAKTQVVGPGTDDFVRNRLTHSLEVAQIARELGRALGCDGDVVEAAALAHDLGHPPFGHNGEQALHEAAQDIGGFEGNAQTLRILTRLEPKTFAPGPSGCSLGLNLTRAVLDAVLKYPWELPAAPHVFGADGTPGQVPKFGTYAQDVPAFRWVRDGAPERSRCLEAQVMDLADDIAYCVHDVEDAVAAGQLDLHGLGKGDTSGVWEAVLDWYLPDVDVADLVASLRRLSSLAEWPDRAYDRSRVAQARLKGLTSALIGRFCSAVQAATWASHGSDPVTRYAADLVVPDGVRVEIAVLKGVAAHFVMRTEERMLLMADQRRLLRELAGALERAGAEELEPVFGADLVAAGDAAARRRVVVDQIASLTDASAIAWHARLTAG